MFTKQSPWFRIQKALLLFVAGCFCFGGLLHGEPLTAMQGSEEADLRAEVNELRRQAAMAEVELANLRRRVHQLEQLLTGQIESPRAPSRDSAPTAEMATRSELKSPEASAEWREETPQIRAESIEPEIEEMELPAEEMAIAATEVPAEPSGETAEMVEPVTSEQPPVEVATPVLSPVDPEARLAYDQAYTLYHEGSFAEAEAEFLRFLSLGTVNELSDNAMFWVGSSRYARGDYPGALRAFRETVETYPDQNKVPDALFKIGQCLEKVGDRANAEEVYRELGRRFPETAAATLAAERLANP